MPVRSCRVTIKDLEGVKHTVEVTAETLYEAVALGFVAIRGNDWVTASPRVRTLFRSQWSTFPSNTTSKSRISTRGLSAAPARPRKSPTAPGSSAFSDFKAGDLLGRWSRVRRQTNSLAIETLTSAAISAEAFHSVKRKRGLAQRTELR